MSQNFLQNWMEDRIEGSLTTDRRGQYQPGFWESVGGSLVGVDAQQVADDVYDVDQNEAGKKVLAETGKSRQQLGIGSDEKLTPERVRGAYSEYLETKKDTDRQQGITDQLTVLAQTQAPQLEEMRATNTRLLQQGNQQFQLSLMQMADSQDARAAELEYQKLRDRKADMQYNERMEALDRKDRRTAMQSIAAGLASLGAAFAM